MNEIERRTLLGAAGLGAIAAAAGARGGPLNPPAGAVTSTAKPLAELEPRTAISDANTPGNATAVYIITQPGSYYLTANGTCPSGKSFLRISSDNVTVDLSGFTITGLAGSLDGITTGGDCDNLTIRNGAIRSFGGLGISTNAIARGMRISDVHASGCSAGMSLMQHTVAENCTCIDNDFGGLRVDLGSVVRSCTAARNGTTGIVTAAASLVESCSAYENGTTGIITAIGSIVRGCSAYFNTINGIEIGSRGLVESCAADYNDAHGIYANERAVVRGNVCNNNGTGTTGAGVRALGLCRVEGNHCIENAVGVEVTGVESLIIANTCADNSTGYTIAAGNRYGPIVNIASTATASVDGFTAASTLSSTDPFTNFNH